MSKGEVLMAPAWNGRVQNAQDKGLPIALTWSQGAFHPSYFYLIKGCRHPEESYRFINFVTQPRPQADFANEIPYGPTNRKALDLIPVGQRQKLPSNPEALKQMWPLNGEWLGKNYDAVNDRWQKFLLG